MCRWPQRQFLHTTFIENIPIVTVIEFK
uniref:Uncharacterized protein n=1 Tax=Anguilla anguilla TaxID=7936 RepID=A0A0E9TB98_ANGAN